MRHRVYRHRDRIFTHRHLNRMRQRDNGQKHHGDCVQSGQR